MIPSKIKIESFAKRWHYGHARRKRVNGNDFDLFFMISFKEKFKFKKMNIQCINIFKNNRLAQFLINCTLFVLK